jgi:hypothetical protein
MDGFPLTGPTRRVRLDVPRLEHGAVFFSWDVSPPSELYARTSFFIRFPPELDVGRVPPMLWWRIMLGCLYPHFALLAPCRVEIPVSLGPAEHEFWLRLIDVAAVNLAAQGAPHWDGRLVELMDEGPLAAPVPIRAESARVAAAFSGGKDSLVQSSLLAELTERPLLVTVASPVDWLVDAESPARARALAGIVARRDVELIEVRSDYRSSWDNTFAVRNGCAIYMNEMCDVLLYEMSTLAVAAANGIGRAFLASEADLQYSAQVGEEIIQHWHFTATATAQGAFNPMLARFGLRLGSVNYPLHITEVMALLWRRYRDVADLQFSCWSAHDGAQACSECGQCAQVAFAILAEGQSPTTAGIDPIRLLRADAPWRTDVPGPRPKLHETRRARNNYERWILSTPTRRVAKILAGDPNVSGGSDLRAALDFHRQLRRRERRAPRPPAGGYVSGFLELIDADLRGPLKAIFDQHISAAPEADFRDTVARSKKLARWIGEPLDQ